MLEQLINFDHQLFKAINVGLTNPFFDWLMPLLRNRYFWAPLYFFLIIFLIRNYKKAGVICILFLLITFGIADYVSASVIKPSIERLRPCNEPGFNTEIIARVVCGSGFSFPSTHATNHFAIAMFLSVVFSRRWKWIWLVSFLWAFSIIFAQVYVGVHFPVDVTCGALLGCLVGYLTATVFLTVQSEKKWNSGL
ncbi:phosphatase PAP2 family protein [Desertivirga xinjiangensis]|uniref:phosphatase PAP2 family protein n=1 Tax=Desertivirga xinjiangensis TaxID=539206 RepID=UPI00210ECA60|nr:phosphatase PAP2 family protein [Pedobacter xinjiangensis]